MAIDPAPCTWDDIDTSCCDNWDTIDPAIQANALAYASLVLWARTGRQYGLCDNIVRPCGRWCNDDGVGGWYWGGGMWLPYVIDGQWYNGGCGCNGGCSSCAPACQVYLPGPVASITSVTVDGVVINPATYYVLDQRWLVRTGTGNCWPDCQDFNVTSGVGSFIVTYKRGEEPPGPLLVAAGTLACEWAKACTGGPCRLTPYITGLSRQGVDFTAVDPMTLLDNGFTGLFEVDSLIAALNPYGQTHRLRLMSPDVDGPRMQTWP